MMVQGWWLILVAQVVGQASASYQRNAMGRNRRQSDHWWRAHQSVSGMGSLRSGGWGAADPGLGRYPHGDSDWGSSRKYIGEVERPKQQEASNPVSVLCNEDKMVVTVQRDLYGNGKLVKVSDLSLGTQPCNSTSSVTDATVVFSVGLQECGTTPQMTEYLLMYSSFLTYNQSAATNLPITRTNSATIPIKCYYPRYDNVSSKAIHPTWVPFSSTANYDTALNFSLRVMNGDWSGPSLSMVFELGEPLNIEASVDTGNHGPMRILADRCVATLNRDTTEGPSYEIVAFNGCLVDGKQEDSSSAFRTQRTQPNMIQFTVDAFKFIDVDSSVIFITCFLRAISAETAPDATNKACSYNKTSNSWLAVEGPSSICSCCELKNCNQATSGSRRLSWNDLSRRLWKREETSGAGPQGERLATLGPLYVLGADENKVLRLNGSSLAMEILMIAGVCSLWLFVLLACILVLTIKPKKSLVPRTQ